MFLRYVCWEYLSVCSKLASNTLLLTKTSSFSNFKPSTLSERPAQLKPVWLVTLSLSMFLSFDFYISFTLLFSSSGSNFCLLTFSKAKSVVIFATFSFFISTLINNYHTSKLAVLICNYCHVFGYKFTAQCLLWCWVRLSLYKC